VPLSVNASMRILKKWQPKKLKMMGDGIKKLMAKSAELKKYTNHFSVATETMGIGGMGVIHAHLLQTDPSYRKLVKEELKNNDMGSSLVFNRSKK